MFNPKKICKIFLTALFVLNIWFVSNSYAVSAPKKAPEAKVEEPVINALSVSSLDLVANPAKFLNQDIIINATFDKFSTFGLDYKKALRPSADYICFLIQRDDYTDHNVPLSELKLFLKRDYAEKFIDLDTGDKIEITGKVFSDALGDAWVDVSKINVVKKAKAQEETKKK